MNGAEAVELADAIRAARWRGVVELHVVTEVLGSEIDGRESTRRNLTKLYPQWSSKTVNLAIRQLLTRQVLQSSGPVLFLQRDFARWQDATGAKMFAQKGSATALERRQKSRATGTPKPVKLRQETPPKPKPTTPAEVKQQASMGKLVGDLLTKTLRGAGPRKGNHGD